MVSLLLASLVVLSPRLDSAADSIAPDFPVGIRTVFLIVFENKDWLDIKGSPSAPFINNVILPMASYCDQYYNPTNLHPSLPNYIWLEAGSGMGITNNNTPFYNHQSTTNHLTSMLATAGVSWRSYQEGISGTNCPFRMEGLYLPHHNPIIYFDDVLSNAVYCISHNRPYSELATDLQSNTVARYNYITPHRCNDGHELCAPVNDKVRQLDNWLTDAIPMILESQAYQEGGAIFITFDEGSQSDGPLPTIVLSPLAKGNGYSNTIFYTHSSMLRTMQTLFGVEPFLRDATNAVDLRDLFLDSAFTPASIIVAPDTTDLGSVLTGTTATATFTVTNAGSLTLNGSVDVTASLAVVAGSPFSLAGGDVTNVTVNVDVSTAGPFEDQVIFHSNAGDSTNSVSGQGTIHSASISASDPHAKEQGNKPARFTVSRWGATNLALTVNYSVSGSATAGLDYAALRGALTIPAGAPSATINVMPFDDALVECPETVLVTLSTSTVYQIVSPSSAEVDIKDNELPTVTITASDPDAAEQFLNKGTLTVTRNGCTNGTLNVSFTVSGTATPGVDYVDIGTSISIRPGKTSATITIKPIEDTIPENPETVILTLSGKAAYQVGSPSAAVVTIADNDSSSSAISATATKRRSP